ncbi:uncharacterized protein [Elaeis guineensis]|uniref:Uncharacterized protein LOC114913993 n=1 Tax=Elaeis guineensis var. tenera TaxID=51953 RepID=A0A8N4EWX5_ELAGV|nr:uncharacterized protein LOC114913993 [Elaeis guineensis]
MVSKISIVLLVAMFGVAKSLAEPYDFPDSGVAPDLSSSRGNLEVSAPKPSALGRRILRPGASLAVNKNQAPSPAVPHALAPCHDGSGMSESPAESPKEMHSPSNHSLHEEVKCAGCKTRPPLGYDITPPSKPKVDGEKGKHG